MLLGSPTTKNDGLSVIPTPSNPSTPNRTQNRSQEYWLEIEAPQAVFGEEDTSLDLRKKSGWRQNLAKGLSHLGVNVCIILLICLDVAVILLATLTNWDDKVFRLIDTVLASLFLLEIALRLVAVGFGFFRIIFALADALIVLVSLCLSLDILNISQYVNYIGIIALQGSRICIRFLTRARELLPAARQMVSTNKMRYQKNGFDLDLTYITNRIIAMGLPSTAIEAAYRNPIDEVARFFNSQHRDHYLIINLCSERSYSSSKFYGRVARFPFDDHNPAPLSTILNFCIFVENFLSAHSSNVVAVHCKGGKGRTGTMICAWLLYSQREAVAEQVLKLFATRRTDADIGGKLQGVAGPSQIRYINYFEELRLRGNSRGSLLRNTSDLYQGGNCPRAELCCLSLNQVALVTNKLTTAQQIDRHNAEWNSPRHWSLVITHYPPPRHPDPKSVEDWHDYMYEHAEVKEYFFKARERDVNDRDSTVKIDISSWRESEALVLAGDLKFQVFRGDLNNPASSPSLGGEGRPKVFCWFWVHTSFLNKNSNFFTLRKDQIDELFRDDMVDEEFNIQLEYSVPPRKEKTLSPVYPSLRDKSPRRPEKSPRHESKKGRKNRS